MMQWLDVPMNQNPGTEAVRETPSLEHAPGNIPGATDRDNEFEIFVIFTNAPATLAALRMACKLAKKLDAHLRLLVPYEVPFALPLMMPAVSIALIEERVRALVSEIPVDVSAHIYLCRDKYQAAPLVLKPNSIVILGSRKRWWRHTEQKMVMTLKGYGHHVILANG
jgi:hypothetical protein